jgi:hypothetical protein
VAPSLSTQPQATKPQQRPVVLLREFRLHFSFARENVDDFVAEGAYDFNRIQQHSIEARETIHINHLETTKFYKFQ